MKYNLAGGGSDGRMDKLQRRKPAIQRNQLYCVRIGSRDAGCNDGKMDKYRICAHGAACLLESNALDDVTASANRVMGKNNG